ncbi:MAG: glyoxalase/bleomycin resistance/dioxygenase family protein [Verrucomicrobia bacterium]|nr:MAG: glyoxalase/bleomycin resistance/dioxygenase family protein [Verrucomicrobiota bacterium]
MPSSLAATLRGFTFYLADPVSSIHRLGLQKSSIRVHLWRNQSEMSAAKSFRIISADHTGITVSNLERSLAFWRDVLGFELSHTAHQTGEMAEQITGVKGAELKLAVVKAPGGHKIKRTDVRPCDVGHIHVALVVDDLDVVLERIVAAGWKAAGKAQTLKTGPNAGKRVVYVRDPDGTTIEFMQIPKQKSSTDFAD